MRIKLNDRQFNFLQLHLSLERPELSKIFDKRIGLLLEIDEDTAYRVRDWVGEKLQKEGFDINYELNDTGKILEQLEDLFHF